MGEWEYWNDLKKAFPFLSSSSLEFAHHNGTPAVDVSWKIIHYGWGTERTGKACGYTEMAFESGRELRKKQISE